ncbi:hypothetical protein [Spirillospora sp. CA-294931]|uniref:class III lanthionine synthetase LanKC N-terminal domain-containing protein n=1 Tax=Spirillospora sp. CA-294931 TaxID=3240042 RepID=UPI003D8C9F84
MVKLRWDNSGVVRSVKGVVGRRSTCLFLLADRDYYETGGTVDPGRRYDADPMPAGWRRRDAGAWTHWEPADLDLPGQGWKVRVSSSLANARSVLGVAAACVEFEVPFRHLADDADRDRHWDGAELSGGVGFLLL